MLRIQPTLRVTGKKVIAGGAEAYRFTPTALNTVVT
jgi:hypothetical protein